MPRAFSETERAAVEARLRAAARRSLAERGLKATSVSALAREAGISKGAFYLFYPTKEALVHDVMSAEEQSVRAALDDIMASAPPEQAAARLLRFLFDVVERHPLFRLLADHDESALLFRSLSPDELAAHLADDDRFFESRCRKYKREGKLGNVDPKVFARLPRLALAIAQQRAFIGDDRYAALVSLVITALSHELAPSV